MADLHCFQHQQTQAENCTETLVPAAGSSFFRCNEYEQIPFQPPANTGVPIHACHNAASEPVAASSRQDKFDGNNHLAESKNHLQQR